MDNILDPKKLDDVIKTTLDSIEKSKNDIFDISESARNEARRAEEELKRIKEETIKIMNELEIKEDVLQKSRQKLLFVNKNFKSFSEEDMRRSYEEADKLLIEVTILREKEKNMIQRRNDLEIHFKEAEKMLEKSDKLISQVSVVFDYLSGNLKGISDKLDDIQQKQMLGIRVIRAQEEERHRVAREIHDGPAQLMSNVVLKAEICEKLVDIDINKTKIELNNLKKVVRDSLQDVRRIIYDLRPMSLDDLGLAPTVQRYANNFKDSTGIDVEVKLSGNLEDLKPVVGLTAFRVIQESLSNVKKHSKADLVKILIEEKNNRIKIIVSDNGVGFDISKLKKDSNNIQGGFGLYGMRERIELLNGRIEIKSEEGKGTKVIIEIARNIEEDIS